jgi:predicted RNase H-like nuclease (RuvC/YqgF family)
MSTLIQQIDYQKNTASSILPSLEQAITALENRQQELLDELETANQTIDKLQFSLTECRINSVHSSKISSEIDLHQSKANDLKDQAMAIQTQIENLEQHADYHRDNAPDDTDLADQIALLEDLNWEEEAKEARDQDEAREVKHRQLLHTLRRAMNKPDQTDLASTNDFAMSTNALNDAQDDMTELDMTRG